MARKRTVLENLANQYTGFDDFAPLDSPGLVGVPTAPTAPPGTSSTQVATTAFVEAKVPLTTRGDILVQGASGPQRMALGADGTMPASNGTDLVNKTIPKVVSYVLSADTGYTLGANIDITHPTGWVYADIEAIGSGGGGASGGSRGSGVVSRGGSGGGPGSYTRRRVFPNEVSSSFFRCLVYAGGVGGASVSTDADGLSGSSGTSSLIHDGATGNVVEQASGGSAGSPTAAGSSGGSELGVVAGGTSSSTGLVGPGGSNSAIGGAGAGGGITTGNTFSGGGSGGRTLAGPIGSTFVAAVAVGGASEGESGSNGTSSLTAYAGRSGGGGASSTTGDGGAGGGGGKYGGAGGGGGASRFGVGASGKGGDGASGIIKLTYFVAAT